MKRKELIGIASFLTSGFFTVIIYLLGRPIPYFEMITSIWGIFTIIILATNFIYERIL